MSFLYLPFKNQGYRVTEGWEYSEQERKIHGFQGHGGIDFSLPRETEIYAAENGIAIASYFTWATNRQYKGKNVWFGLGHFVQIYHPEHDLFTVYGHFSKIAPEIKFHSPRKDGRFFFPVGHKILPLELLRYRFATKVKKGQLIGYADDSGLGWGYCDYPKRPDPKKYPSWDEPHLHFEVVDRVGPKRVKQHFDPYGIKGDFKDYPDTKRQKNKENMGDKGVVLWVVDENGMPRFIK